MGWSLSPYHFCAFTDTFVRHLRQPDPGGFTTHQGRPTQPDNDRPSKRFLRHTRWRGAKILPYVDGFLLFAATRALALALRQRVDRLLTGLGLLRHPSKGFGSRRNTATTWASTSTQLQLTSSPQRKSFRSWPNKLDTYCNVQQEISYGSLSRNSNHSLVKRSTFFLLFRRQDSSCANSTPYLATSGEAASASPRSSVAI
jgi:hypothetical protein